MLPIRDLNAYVTHHSLFSATDKVLLAVSGGKDSVLMVHLFKAAGYNVGIAHCNFNLRAEESQRDETFVKMLATTLDVPFHVIHFQTSEYAIKYKMSTQMAARNLRYEWFEETRKKYGYHFIALAQHTDDAIETVLLNLTRGTGIAGLHGILPKRGALIRPLLFLTASEIEDLVNKNGIDYVEDSSNASTKYSRNKIRQQVIPVLKEINPSIEHTFVQNMHRFAETELVLQNYMALLKKKLFDFRNGATHISVEELLTLNPMKLLTFELFREFGFTETTTGDLLQALNSQSGTSFYSRSHRILVDRKQLIITELRSDETHPLSFLHPGDSQVSFGSQTIMMQYSEIVHFERDKMKAFVDESKLIFPLMLRSRQEGDRFMPIGMKGFKKLSNFFIDEKVPLSQKNAVPLLINGNGEMIWIGGLRQDDRYKVTPTTKKVVIFELQNLKG